MVMGNYSLEGMKKRRNAYLMRDSVNIYLASVLLVEVVLNFVKRYFVEAIKNLMALASVCGLRNWTEKM